MMNDALTKMINDIEKINKINNTIGIRNLGLQEGTPFNQLSASEMQRLKNAGYEQSVNAVNQQGGTPFGQLNNSELQLMQDEMRALQQKGGSGDGFLTDVEVNRFIELRNQLNPNLPQERLLTTVREPVDIDGASAPPNPMSMEELNQFLENIYRARIPRDY